MADRKNVFRWAAIVVCVILCSGSEALAQDDVCDVPSTSVLAGGDTNKRYFLIGEYEQAAPAAGFGLIIVVPGDEGGSEVESFVKRIYKKALPKNYLVAQLVEVKWTAEQQVMWPTEKVPAEKQEFSTEEFIGAVIKDVKNKYRVNNNHIFTLCWSSAGPAGYAYSLREDSLATGSFIAMSGFEPESLPPLEQARGRAYVLFQSARDERYPFSAAQQAYNKLKEKNAKASLLKYRGKQNWQEKAYTQIRVGIKLLERDHSRPVRAAGSPAQRDVESARTGKMKQKAAASGVSGKGNSVKIRSVWEISIKDALGMCIGDWNVDGKPELLVSDANDPPNLHVIDVNGREIETVELPGWFWTIECGQIKGQSVLLAYRNGGLSVRAVDRQGNKLWSYVCKDGVNCAHWGDIDGDGNDEMVVGTKGYGGLHGVNENGKRLWKASDIGSVPYQSIIGAKEGRPGTVIATGGMGVHIFDSNGKSVDVLEIKNFFVIPIQAAEVDVNDTIQIFGIGAKGDDEGTGHSLFYAMAFDMEGKVAWEKRLSAKSGAAACFTAGDLDGDGQAEWIYAATSHILAIASPEEEEIATIDMPRPGEMAVLNAKDKKGKLILRRGEKFFCYVID